MCVHALSWHFELVREAPIGALGDDPLTPMNSTLLRARQRYNGDSGGYTGGKLEHHYGADLKLLNMAGITGGFLDVSPGAFLPSRSPATSGRLGSRAASRSGYQTCDFARLTKPY